MRVRFIFALLSTSIFVTVSIGVNAIVLTTPFGSERAYTLTSVALVAIAAVATYTCYETEVFQRAQFLHSQRMLKTNDKLTKQLQTLSRVLGKKVADFDSPLEKSVIVIRSLMADPFLGAQHLQSLNQIMHWLGSSNLLTPDFENQLTNFTDNEQEAWLFSEIAPRRRDLMNRKEVDRRRSVANESHTKLTIDGFDSNIYYPFKPNNPDTPKSAAKYSENLEDLVVSSNVANILCQIPVYSFPIFDLVEATNRRPLATMAFSLFQKADLFQTFDLPIDKFKNFICAIEKGYHEDLPCK